METVATWELAYDGNWMRSFRPFGTDKRTGTGTALGRNAERVRGSNQPHRRSDGVLLPDVRGVVESADGAVVVFHLSRRIDFPADPAQPRHGLEVLTGSS